MQNMVLPFFLPKLAKIVGNVFECPFCEDLSIVRNAIFTSIDFSTCQSYKLWNCYRYLDIFLGASFADGVNSFLFSFCFQNKIPAYVSSHIRAGIAFNSICSRTLQYDLE
jgi:hypothetical protein